MSAIKVSLYALTALISMGTPSSIGVHHLTKETIWDQKSIKENALPDTKGKSLDVYWSKLKDKLSSASSQITDKDLISAISISQPDENLLKNWCINAYKSTYKSIFWQENLNLIKNVKAACIWTIKDQIGVNNAFEAASDDSQTNKGELEEKVKLLQGENSVKKSISSDGALNEIKEKADDTNNWKKLEKWCFEAYKKGFQGESQSLWKLANEFCKKER